MCFIQSLVADLSEREQQSELARSSHLQNVDYLLELHRSRLAELELNFNTRLDELGSEYNTERYIYINAQKLVLFLNLVNQPVPDNIIQVFPVMLYFLNSLILENEYALVVRKQIYIK